MDLSSSTEQSERATETEEGEAESFEEKDDKGAEQDEAPVDEADPILQQKLAELDTREVCSHMICNINHFV